MRVEVAFDAEAPNADGVNGNDPTLPPFIARKYCADVVEKKYPLSNVLRNALAEVVENAAPWFDARKYDAEVVENAFP
jgi:hypothetical protein